MAKLLCETIVDQVVPISSARAAEPVNLLENTFRAVNIALANEIATIPDKLDVDVWEAVHTVTVEFQDRVDLQCQLIIGQQGLGRAGYFSKIPDLL